MHMASHTLEWGAACSSLCLASKQSTLVEDMGDVSLCVQVKRM